MTVLLFVLEIFVLALYMLFPILLQLLAGLRAVRNKNLVTFRPIAMTSSLLQISLFLIHYFTYSKVYKDSSTDLGIKPIFLILVYAALFLILLLLQYIQYRSIAHKK
ncbi:MAG: hypothetical protein RIS29_1079 [Bacteroidota bacterium]|jgi:hypothetical protein